MKKIEELENLKEELKKISTRSFNGLFALAAGIVCMVAGAVTSFSLALKFLKKLWMIYLSPPVGILAGAIVGLLGIGVYAGILSISNKIKGKKREKIRNQINELENEIYNKLEKERQVETTENLEDLSVEAQQKPKKKLLNKLNKKVRTENAATAEETSVEVKDAD